MAPGHVPMTGDVLLGWLPGWWELDGQAWEVDLDPETAYGSQAMMGMVVHL